MPAFSRERKKQFLHDVLNNNLLQTTLSTPAVTVPFVPNDWPNPARYRAQKVDARTWIQSLSPDALLPPFVSGEWNNSVKQKVKNQLQGFGLNLLETTLATPAPTADEDHFVGFHVNLGSMMTRR